MSFRSFVSVIKPYITPKHQNFERLFYLTALLFTSACAYSLNIRVAQTLGQVVKLVTSSKKAEAFSPLMGLIGYSVGACANSYISEFAHKKSYLLIFDAISKDMIKKSNVDNRMYMMQQKKGSSNPSKIMSGDLRNWSIQYAFIYTSTLTSVANILSGLSVMSVGFIGLYTIPLIYLVNRLKTSFRVSKEGESELTNEIQGAESNAPYITRFKRQEVAAQRQISKVDKILQSDYSIMHSNASFGALKTFHNQLMIISGVVWAYCRSQPTDIGDISQFATLFRKSSSAVTWLNNNVYKIIGFFSLSDRIDKLNKLRENSKTQYPDITFSDSNELAIKNLNVTFEDSSKPFLSVKNITLSGRVTKITGMQGVGKSLFLDVLSGAISSNVTGEIHLANPHMGQVPIIGLCTGAEFFHNETFIEALTRGNPFKAKRLQYKTSEFLKNNKLAEVAENPFRVVPKNMTERDMIFLQVAAVINTPPKILTIDKIFDALSEADTKKVQAALERDLPTDTKIIFAAPSNEFMRAREEKKKALANTKWSRKIGENGRLQSMGEFSPAQERKKSLSSEGFSSYAQLIIERRGETSQVTLDF